MDTLEAQTLEKTQKTERESISSKEVQSDTSSIDIHDFHVKRAGRLVVDPEEARIEFGAAFAARLKTTPDGHTILWPQPHDTPEDPQNWSARRKALNLLIVMMAAVVPDFDSGIGIAVMFEAAKAFHTTPATIVNVTTNWSIFLLGWGGIFAVMGMKRYGRLPVLFWSQLLSLGFLVGCTFAPNLATFGAMRCLAAFFGTAPQVTGLYIVTDMYPFHLQARMLNVWTMGFIISPFLSPFAFGFLVARAPWRWSYGIGCIYSAIVVFMIMFFMEETMFDRTVKPLPPRPTSGLRYRVETLFGFTGKKMAKYRDSWKEVAWAPINVAWRPHLLPLMIFEGVLFGFGIGVNVTFAVFLEEPKPQGFGFSAYGIAGMYGTPIVAVLLGEVVGRYLNDWIMRTTVRRNHGVFEAESRLWACYIATVLYIVGFVVLGAALQHHLSAGALVMGWGIAELATMVNTVAVYAYANDAFPKHQGEISGLINLFRTLGGFAVAYFQVPWAEKHGALQTFGCEAAIVAALFIIVVPWTQWKGRSLRERFSLH
ncbi:major facilitator superfamily domain-containing protein [Schizophyllum commune]